MTNETEARAEFTLLFNALRDRLGHDIDERVEWDDFVQAGIANGEFPRSAGAWEYPRQFRLPAYEVVKRALVAGKVSHSRQGSGCWREIIYVYGWDETSPTRVTLLAGLERHEVAALGLSALSPTEPR